MLADRNRMICRCSILGILVISLIAAESRKSAPEPKISSIYPMTAMAGHAFKAIIRGTALAAPNPWFSEMSASALASSVLPSNRPRLPAQNPPTSFK